MGCNSDRKHPPRDSRCKANLADLQLDDTDKILLTIARHFCHDLAFPDRGHRRVAVSIAEISFGSGRGAGMATAVLRAIEAMRIARRDVFFYNNPDCPICSRVLTDAEFYLVQVFNSVRTGRNSAAATNAMLLCEGNDYAPFLKAVSQVFSVFSQARWQEETKSWLLD